MKKLFLLMSMAAAMIPFAGCQKNEIKDPTVANGEGSTFELVADISQTKTTLDGLNVEWENGDIIYVVTTDKLWGADWSQEKPNLETIAEFKYQDGKFSTEATIADGEHTFNAMYARADQKSYHRGASSTHKLVATQQQNCTAPTAHIKDNDALVGTFTATTPMEAPAQVAMKHLYTMMQVNIKNNTGADVEVKKFEMTTAADLAGVFNVTSFDTPAITTKSGAVKTITVEVSGGTVANTASLPIYFVMAPLSEYSGDVTFKVTDAENKTYTKTVTVSDLTFEAGAYNTTPYTISKADVVEPEPENPEGTVTDVLTRAMIGVTGTSYSTWSGKTATSSAVYAGNSAGGNESIQLRSDKSTSGIVTTVSGGVVKKIIINWNTNTNTARKLDVYGKSTAYTQAADLYSNSTMGTKIGTIDYGDSELVVDGEYKFIGLRSQSGAMYLSEIRIVWETAGEGGGDTTTPQPRNLAFSSETVNATLGQQFTHPVLSGTTTGVTYSSTDTDVATVIEATGVVTLVGPGTTTIKASAPATAEYEADEASYTLTVSAAENLVKNGSYVIAVLEDGVYYAVSSDANGDRRAYVELNDYSGEESYVSHNSKIVWTITNVVGGITINTGEQYWGTKKNGITLVTSNAATIAISRSENAYLLSGNCGEDGIRYVSKNGTYGFGFYAASNKEDIYLIPATFVALPDLTAPVATAELNNAKDGINVSWNAVPNAHK